MFYIYTGNFRDSLANTIICNKGIWYSAGSHTLARGDTPGEASVCNRITGSWQQPCSDIVTSCCIWRAFFDEAPTPFLAVQRDGFQLHGPVRHELCTAPRFFPWEKQNHTKRWSEVVGTVSVRGRGDRGKERYRAMAASFREKHLPRWFPGSNTDVATLDGEGNPTMDSSWPLSHTLRQDEESLAPINDTDQYYYRHELGGWEAFATRATLSHGVMRNASYPAMDLLILAISLLKSSP